jgi:hypothetical protein
MWWAGSGGTITMAASQSVINTPTFNVASAYADTTGQIIVNGAWAFSGSAHGKIYLAETNGVIHSNGITFPGDIPGTVDTGGIYV